MNKPITLCDRCKENARCCLNYDGDNCRRSRTVEPTNADRIRSMDDYDLAIFLENVSCKHADTESWFNWLTQTHKVGSIGWKRK